MEKINFYSEFLHNIVPDINIFLYFKSINYSSESLLKKSLIKFKSKTVLKNFLNNFSHKYATMYL